MAKSLTDLIAGGLGDNVLIYRKDLNVITGGVIGSIMLGQLIYWAAKNDYKPFYKFIQPCGHALYKEGDSWAEELCIDDKTISRNFKKFEELGILTRKTDLNRLTWHTINKEILDELLKEKLSLAKTPNGGLYDKAPNRVASKTPNGDLYTYTENTAETTSKTTKKSEADATHLSGKKSQKIFLSVADKPSFVSPDIWQDFCQYKKERKESYTQTGLKAFLSKLEKINAKGANVNEALLETMANDWRGVFEPKQGFNAKSKAEGVKKSRQVLREWAAKKMAAENEIIDGEVIDDNARIQCGF